MTAHKAEAVLDNIKLETIEAVQYIARVTNKQGQLFDCKDMFGDGSRWKNIGYSGFEICHKAVAQAVIDLEDYQREGEK